MFKYLLVHVDPSDASLQRLRLSLDLACRFGAALSGLHVVAPPEVSLRVRPSAAEALAKRHHAAALAQARQAYRQFRDEAERWPLPAQWDCREGAIAPILAGRAQAADLLVIGQFDGVARRVPSLLLLSEKVILRAGRPVLVVPPETAATPMGRRVAVMWDGGAPAARAVADALPFLRNADHVSILALQPSRSSEPLPCPAADIAAYLQGHGVMAECQEVSTRYRQTAAAVLDACHSSETDLLVMGAYRHGPALEWLFGGSTESLLRRASFPLFVSR
jgi:nucleotide-binding universal stress UspA family protein